MEKIFLQILVAAYASVGILAKIGYWPTFKDLYYHKKLSANIYTYALWSFTTSTAVLYGVFVLKDFWFIAISGLDFLSCFSIFLLSVNLKYLKVSKSKIED